MKDLNISIKYVWIRFGIWYNTDNHFDITLKQIIHIALGSRHDRIAELVRRQSIKYRMVENISILILVLNSCQQFKNIWLIRNVYASPVRVVFQRRMLALICDHFRATTSAQLEMRRASQLAMMSNDYCCECRYRDQLTVWQWHWTTIHRAKLSSQSGGQPTGTEWATHTSVRFTLDD